MNKTRSIVSITAGVMLSGTIFSAPLGQYNMSLEDKTTTGRYGEVAHPHAVAVDRQERPL